MLSASGFARKKDNRAGAASSFDEERLQVPFLDLLGHGCYLTWCFIVSWCSIISANTLPFSTTEILFFRLCMFFAVIIAALIVRCFKPLLNKVNNALLAIIAVLLTAPCVFLLLFTGIAWYWLALSWFLAGFGQVLCLYHWRLRIVTIGWEQIIWLVTWSFIVAAVVFTLVSYLQTLAGLLFTLMLPAASMAMYLRAARVDAGRLPEYPNDCGVSKESSFSNKGNKKQKSRHTIVWRRRNLFIAIYSAAFGFITCLMTTDTLAPLSGLAVGPANLLAGLFMIFVFTRSKLDFSRLLPALFLPVVAVCFLGFSWLESVELRTVFIAVLFFLFACYDMLNASTIYAKHDVRTQEGATLGNDITLLNRGLLSFSQDRLGNAIGQFAGWGIGFLVYTFWGLQQYPLIIFCFATVALFTIVNLLLFEHISFTDDLFIVDTRNLYNDGQVVLQQVEVNSGRWQKQCDNVAKRYSLSPRQTEIFVLLAKGRNARFIQDKLVLSNYTVKSHIYSIYRKLNIHSRQELIDLVEKG